MLPVLSSSNHDGKGLTWLEFFRVGGLGMLSVGAGSALLSHTRACTHDSRRCSEFRQRG